MFEKKYLVKTFFWVKYKIRFGIPDKIWQTLASRIAVYRNQKYLEQRKSFGKLNPDLTFYVIRRRPPGWGFFANFFYVIKGLIYAEENNYIPVVDMENYWIGELSSLKKINNTHNAWCYFFDQVSNFSLDEVYQSKNVILSNGFQILEKSHWLNDKNFAFITQVDKLNIIRKIISKYIRINEVTQNHVKLKKYELNWDPTQTLAIFIRGTNYFSSQIKLTANYRFFVDASIQVLNINSITKIYVSTEDFMIYNNLLDSFSGYRVIQNLRFKQNLSIKEWESNQKLTFDGGVILGYEKTLAYLTEAILLSECPNFIGSISNASAFILSSENTSTANKFIVRGEEKYKINF